VTAPSSRLTGPTLEDLDFVILENAAQRKNHCIEPVPETARIEKQALRARLELLLKRKLVAEGPAKLEDGIWRTDETQHHKTLKITKAGLAVLRKAQATGTSVNRAKTKPAKVVPAVRRTKVDIICVLLRRPQGAPLAALAKATGWQPHSIRGFLSRLKNDRRIKFRTEIGKDNLRRYRITGGR